MRYCWLVGVLAMALSAGCGDDSLGPGGAGGGGGSGGIPDGLGFGPGEVAAGILSSGQLPPDDGLGVFATGDIFLANEHFGVVIEDVDAGKTLDSDLYVPFSGGIVGLAAVEFDTNDNARFGVRPDYNEMGIGLSRFMIRAQSVSVVNDGSDGMPAVVSATGPLSALPFLEDVLSDGMGLTFAGTQILNADDSDDATFEAAEATVEYELAAGNRYLDIYYTTDNAVDATPVYLFIQNRRMTPFVPGFGFGNGMPADPFSYVAYVNEGAIGYAFEDPVGAMVSPIGSFGSTEISGVQPLTRMMQTQFAASAREHLGRLHVGGTGIDGLLQAIATTRGDTQRTITGVVRDASGNSAPGVRVFADAVGEPRVTLTKTTTDASGGYTLHVPADAEVELSAFVRGEGIGSTSVGTGTTGDIDLPGSGTLNIAAVDGDSTALPVRVQIIDETNDYAPFAVWGEQVVPGWTYGRPRARCVSH